MIKLIATDMDGTLLDENKNLPKDFFNTLNKLEDKNIKFVVASGRPYVTLYNDFKPYSDNMYFICDNGAYISEPGNPPIISSIDKELLHKILIACENIPNIVLLLCGIKHTYHKNINNEFNAEINKYYLNKKEVTDFYNIDDEIFKIAIYDEDGSKDNSYLLLAPLFKEKCNIVVSAKNWLDINALNVNKGNALKQIQNDYNISYNETMVFGDFYNDIEMLQSAHYSFVMENANEDMKQYGNYIAKSNKENGVLKAIDEYIFI